MDLVTFTEGVQSIRVQHNDASLENSAPSRPFVPLGESVIKNTEALFSRKASNQERLKSLIASPGHAGIDPNEFAALATTTHTALMALASGSGIAANQDSPADASFQQTLQRALTVLNALNEDRRLLQSNLSALEKA